MKNILLSVVVAVIVLVGIGASAPTAQAMNKAELIEAMASKAGLSKEDSKKALDGFLSEAGRALKKGDRISLIGFGSFSVSKSAETEEIEFFPSVRSTGANNRHKGNTVTGQELMESVLGKCEDGDSTRSCPVSRVLGSLVNTTNEALLTGDLVEWGDFGTFETAMATSISKRSARTGRNPQTGKEIQIAAKNTVKFKAGAELSK